uniref:E3 ubiquitin-protein ligase RBBP6 n=1 Tax=Dendroctonus ponderosae TaxID=77166 RepID=A0AAR5PLW5_DENPD
MSVHYRFKSALEYDTITFDGLHISIKDLKNAIIQQKRIGKNSDFDLRITNAQTNDVYEDENALIPKNTSLLIARIPVTTPKQKQWEGYGGNDTPPAKLDDGGAIGKTVDLANLDAPEDDKIRAMMSQSTQDYDPSNYVKIRGANQVGPVPQNYRCFKCHQTGHWIKDCTLGQGVEPVEIKKSTGIPQSFMVPVDGPQVPGAMMMANGQYAVPALDLQAYNQKSSGPAPVQEKKPDIPDDLLCSICSDLLADAVMIPCCGNSFCDECVRSVLLDSEDHECPDCHEKDISPATLIPNRFLRKSVANFKNTTGYEKAPTYRAKTRLAREDSFKKDMNSPAEIDSTDKDGLKETRKTIISEADSTEHNKAEVEVSKDAELDPPKTSDNEGPPGVSPKQSPVHKITSKISKGDRGRDRGHRSNKSPKHHRSRSPSPRKMRTRRTSPYVNRNSLDRNGTPLRDDTPPTHNSNYPPPPDVYSRPPGELLPPIGVMSHGVPPMQGLPPVSMPPGAFVAGQPPPFHSTGAPPNFRMPPPGSQIPPYMPPGPYQVPNRPVFDPMGGPPPGNFGPSYSGRMRDYGRRSGRDRTPPGLIDDPLAAFNRILREKDEKRARLQRMSRRTWSRSRSRSRSFSRSPPPMRRRSRSPKRRRSRSRSRSFSISRSRSRSYSPSPRGSPLPPLRRSPPPLQTRRGPPGRFRSPLRSPPLRRRIDRIDFERDYERGSFREKPRSRRSNSRDRFYNDREREYDRVPIRSSRGLPPPCAAPPPQQWGGQRDVYYPEPPASGFQTRFPQQIHHIQPERKYELIAPPGVEQPPIPGLESELPPLNEFDKPQKKLSPRKERHSPREHRDRNKSIPREHEREKDRRDRDRRKDEKRSRSRSKTPEKWRNPSPKSSGTPERPRKRRSSTDSKDDKRKDKDRHRDHSEEDKKKIKDKKKHKDKKDDKKKKKDKRDKHKSKDRKDKKEEFKQIVPKAVEETEETRKKIEEKKKRKGEEELKKQQEERKKEERRLRFIEDEKRKKEEEAKKEASKQKAIEEARQLLENEERQKLEVKIEEKQEQKKIDLYDEVIPTQDLAKEIRSDFKSPEPSANMHQAAEPAESTLELFDSMIQKDIEDGEVTEEQEKFQVAAKDGEEEDPGILELHSDMDIKLDESDILAPFPEKSKWEVDEDGQIQNSPGELRDFSDSKTKVSSEVLKRAENVIFARAINSIRPIEIKKITGERAKFFADEKVVEEAKKVEAPVEKPPRIPIKDRLGRKVDEPDSKIVAQRRSSSPYGRRDRRMEVDKRHDRKRTRGHETNRERDRHRSRSDRSIDKSKKSRKDDKDKQDEKIRERRKRTRSRSPSEDPKKKKKEKEKEKKPKKEKSKKHDTEKKVKDERGEEKHKSTVDKRKVTLDEANFEPDYDLELHEDELSEKDSKKGKEARKTDRSDGESSSSESSSSSSEDERRRKKRRSHKKKKKRDSSSSESESSSQSSDTDKDRKRKKHRKSKKKKKKAKHK